MIKLMSEKFRIPRRDTVEKYLENYHENNFLVAQLDK